FGDIRFVVMRDMGDIEPGAMQVWARESLDPGKRLRFNRSELREILRRDLGNPGALCSRRRCHRRLGWAGKERQHVVLGNATFLAGAAKYRQINTKLSRHAT